jgi:hypothetical protein
LFDKGFDGIKGRGLSKLKKGFIVIGRERRVCCGGRGGAKSRKFFEV